MTGDFEVPSEHAPGLGKGKGRKAAAGWTNAQLGKLLSVRQQSIGLWTSGEQYPTTKNLKKIEAVFGWPASEQIDLIPLEGRDLRYGMVLNKVLNEWKAANPRTVRAHEVQAVVKSNAPRKV